MLRILTRFFGLQSLGRRPTYKKPVAVNPAAYVLTCRTSKGRSDPNREWPNEVLQGKCYVIDGDTIVINRIHVRLAGIDAPEMDQPYGRNAKFAMIALCKGHIITAHIEDSDDYNRVVAKCIRQDGTDLSAALVAKGLALDWAKFSGGAYRHLEPDGVRKRLWRVEAKHQGRLRMPIS